MHDISTGQSRKCEERRRKFDWQYLLSICVWLECDVPVVVMCKLDTYHLWTVVIFKQWLNFLEMKNNGLTLEVNVIKLTKQYLFPSFLYLNGCGFRDLPQDDNAPLVIWTHFFTLLIHLYHRRGWGKFNLLTFRHITNATCFSVHPPPFSLTSQDI